MCLRLVWARPLQALSMTKDDWSISTRVSLVHNDMGLELFNKRQYREAIVEFTKVCGQAEKVSKRWGTVGGRGESISAR